MKINPGSWSAINSICHLLSPFWTFQKETPPGTSWMNELGSRCSAGEETITFLIFPINPLILPYSTAQAVYLFVVLKTRKSTCRKAPNLPAHIALSCLSQAQSHWECSSSQGATSRKGSDILHHNESPGILCPSVGKGLEKFMGMPEPYEMVMYPPPGWTRSCLLSCSLQEWCKNLVILTASVSGQRNPALGMHNYSSEQELTSAFFPYKKTWWLSSLADSQSLKFTSRFLK